MKNKTLSTVRDLGQSFWLDFISKEILDNGQLLSHIQDDCLMGLTSNPAIFENVISKTNLYDQAIVELRTKGAVDEKLIYENLAINDLRRAADLFLPTYEKTGGKDGFVSLEVSPTLAFDAKETVEEGRKLFRSVDRKNLMIKVPGTAEGMKAIYELTRLGINVNVTLLFSLESYEQAANAYLNGLKERVKNGLEINHVNSVASFFISRIDSKIDALLQKVIDDEKDEKKKTLAKDLLGKIAIFNAKNAYVLFEKLYAQKENLELLAKGANPQRLLWASTGTKNKNYSDILYVESLIGPQTVNTIPPSTFEAFKDHGQAKETLFDKMDQIPQVFENLKSLNIDLDKATSELLQEGVDIFIKSFENLLSSVKEKSMSLEKKK